MKTTIVLVGILSGYFFPYYTFSIILFLAAISFSFLVGFVFSDMMNANSLSNKVDREKVTFQSNISIYKMNTISLWVGVFVFCVAITGLIKHILLNLGVNQLSIIILFFSLGVFLKLLKNNWSISKLLRQ
jgi:hypothetical protein